MNRPALLYPHFCAYSVSFPCKNSTIISVTSNLLIQICFFSWRASSVISDHTADSGRLLQYNMWMALNAHTLMPYLSWSIYNNTSISKSIKEGTFKTTYSMWFVRKEISRSLRVCVDVESPNIRRFWKLKLRHYRKNISFQIWDKHEEKT